MEKVPGLTGMIVGGGSPCQGLSRLSSERSHLEDERSALFYEAGACDGDGEHGHGEAPVGRKVPGERGP